MSEFYGPRFESTPIYEGWVVEFGYYGIVTDRTRWVVEIVRDEAMAKRIWAARDEISKLVESHGGEARLSVKDVAACTLGVSEYDFGRWSDCVVG